MFRHRKTQKNLKKRYKKRSSSKKLRGGSVPDIIAVMKSLIPANHTTNMSTGSGTLTPASTKNPFSKGGSRKYTKQRGGLARHASKKTWVCRGNIGCARNINIY